MPTKIFAVNLCHAPGMKTIILLSLLDHCCFRFSPFSTLCVYPTHSLLPWANLKNHLKRWLAASRIAIKRKLSDLTPMVAKPWAKLGRLDCSVVPPNLALISRFLAPLQIASANCVWTWCLQVFLACVSGRQSVRTRSSSFVALMAAHRSLDARRMFFGTPLVVNQWVGVATDSDDGLLCPALQKIK
jgi:hypothetical protein